MIPIKGPQAGQHDKNLSRDRGGRLFPSLRLLLVVCLTGLQAFAVLSVVSLIALSTERSLVRQASEVMQESGARLSSQIENFLTPAQQAAELSARLVENGVLQSQNDDAVENHLFRLLQIAPQQSGLYFGRPDGSFVFVMRTDQSGVFRTKIMSSKNDGAKYIWRDESFSLLRESTDPQDTYDPRTRPWYISAVHEETTVWTDPYTFFTSQRPGISTASPVFIGSEVFGVFGVDIEIGVLSTMLAEEQLGRGGASLILTDMGQVVALSDVDTPVSLQNLAQFDDADARALFEPLFDPELGISSDGPIDLSNTDNIAALVPITTLELPWKIGLYAPRSSFVNEFGLDRRLWMWFALGVVLTSAIIAIFLANRIGQNVAEFGRVTGVLARRGLNDPAQLRAPYRELADTRETLLSEIGKRRQFEAAYGRTFEVSSRGMARIDPTNGSFLHVNKQLCKILDRPENWFLEQSLAELIRQEDARYVSAFTAAMETDQECFFEAQFVTGVAKNRWLRFTAILIRDESGEPDHALAVFDDVEKDIQARQDLGKLRRDLIHVGRVNAMGEFAGGLAHELNQPLAAMVHDIDSARMILSDEPPDRQELNGVLTDLEDHALRAGEIIRGLRNVVRKDKGRLRPFDVSALLQQTLAILSAEARELKVDLVYVPVDGLIAIGNRTQVAQIVVNLVRNSFEALKEISDPRITMTAQPSNDGIEISVTDNGAGLPKGAKPFVKFDTTKSSGLGLGLSICKSLAETNEGKITYQPAKPNGANFVLRLKKGD